MGKPILSNIRILQSESIGLIEVTKWTDTSK